MNDQRPTARVAFTAETAVANWIHGSPNPRKLNVVIAADVLQRNNVARMSGAVRMCNHGTDRKWNLEVYTSASLGWKKQ